MGAFRNGSTTESADTDDVDASWRVESGSYPSDLQEVDQWLVWKPTDDGRKVPRAPWETGGDQFVSARNPDVWTDFETAQEWTEKLPGYELAFNTRDREAPTEQEQRERAEAYRKYRENLRNGTKPGDE